MESGCLPLLCRERATHLLFPATSESGHELIGIRAFSSIPIVRRSTEANPSLLTNAPTPNGSISNSLRIRKGRREQLLRVIRAIPQKAKRSRGLLLYIR